MTNQITFNSQTEKFYYPDGVTETLEQYNARKYSFEYIQGLQNALEQMKILYQNPGCLTEKSYKDAKRKIQEEFDYWEMNIFQEYEDKLTQ
jgi:hypothetical protein